MNITEINVQSYMLCSCISHVNLNFKQLLMFHSCSISPGWTPIRSCSNLESSCYTHWTGKTGCVHSFVEGADMKHAHLKHVNSFQFTNQKKKLEIYKKS